MQGFWYDYNFKYLMMKKILNTDQAPAPVGPYNQATAHNGVLYVSGQIAINQATGELIIDNIEDETTQVMENLKAILENAGTSFENVLKCSVFVADMGNYARINAVYATYFDEATAPARELVEVANLPKYVNVEISLLATV
ncbi:MAG: 2-iminobutanoate/2-iminopropanoate deaminase [Maribacter sp.]|jgi:2-iminobutanoate/2-iminopropanoate deaminase